MWNKGAAYERQLKKLLEAKGFYVVRAAGSGVDSTSPDLVALSSTKKFALECKAVDSKYLWLEKEKLESYKRFEQQTGVPVFVAWKTNRKEWRFFPLNALQETVKGFTLHEKDLSSGMTLEQVLQ